MLKEIDDLNNLCREKLQTLRRSQVNANKLLDRLYYYPYATTTDVCENLDVDYQTANNLLKIFVKLDILEVNNKKRYKMYTFKKYLDIFINSNQ